MGRIDYAKQKHRACRQLFEQDPIESETRDIPNKTSESSIHESLKVLVETIKLETIYHGLDRSLSLFQACRNVHMSQNLLFF